MWETISFPKWETDPYKHAILYNVFPEGLYNDMLNNLPPNEEYSQYNDIYPNRFLHSCSKGIWKDVSNMLHELFPKNKTRVQLCRDFPGYSIGPHTDGPQELYTYLLYITYDAIPEGTIVYKPIDDSFSCGGRKHHDVNGFKKVKQAPYGPNAGFVFERSDKSFHGVEKTKHIRNLIQLSVYR